MTVERVAAIDVGKAEIVVCARVPAATGRRSRAQEVRKYSTMTLALIQCSDWLTQLQVTRVVMEARTPSLVEVNRRMVGAIRGKRLVTPELRVDTAKAQE